MRVFGRKQVQAPTPRYANEPRPAYREPDGEAEQGVDAAIAMLSQALGMDLDFGTAYIFAPSHWDIAGVGDMLLQAGIAHNMKGNMVQLLKSPLSVAKLSAMPADHPLRQVLEQTGFGTALYDPNAENGCSDGLAKMQAEALKGFAAKYDNPEARRYAVFDLHKWSSDVLKGKVKLEGR